MKRESRQSKETFPRRTARPGAAGLANEVRPGLGTRGSGPAKGGKRRKAIKGKAPPHDRDPLGRDKPLVRPAPREQKPNTLAHEEERDTAVTGHSSAE